MLQPISQVQKFMDSSQNFFYDHLHNQIYYLEHGKLHRRNLKKQCASVNVPVQITVTRNQNKLFPSLLIVKGQGTLNLQKTSLTNKNNHQCVVRTDVPISRGSVWQWYVPTSLNQVKLGYVEITKSGNCFQTYFDLSSSTDRTVTFSYQGQSKPEIKVWVNNYKPAKDFSKIVTIDTSRQSTFYPLASCLDKGSSVVFNPFAENPDDKTSFNPITSIQSISIKQSNLVESKLRQIKQLSKDKMLLVAENGFVKVIHRNSQTNQFVFPNVYLQEDHIVGLLNLAQFYIVSQNSHKPQSKFAKKYQLSKLYALLSETAQRLIKSGETYKSNQFKVLIQKLLILRSLDSQFTLSNLCYLSELDRSYYSSTSTSQFFNLPKATPLSIPKSSILNQQSWSKIQGHISSITQNYILSIQDETVLVYHVGDRVKEVFRENIVFFQFNKTTFLERFNQNDLRVLRKEQATSSIYKLLTGCLTKDKTLHKQLFAVKDNDLKEMIHDFKITQTEAKLSLEQTGNVQDALVWLSINQQDRTYIEKHEDSKGKHNENKIRGSLIELESEKLIKLVLHINNNIYLLGYDPQSVRHFLTRGEKQYISLSDFSRQTDIAELNVSLWYNSQNHKTLTIVDYLNLKQTTQFLFKQNDKIFAFKNQADVSMKAEITFNSKVIFQTQRSINVKSFEPFDLFIETSEVTKAVNGQIFYQQKLNNTTQKTLKTTFIHGMNLYSNLSSNIQSIVQIEAILDSNNFVKSQQVSENEKAKVLLLLIESGPPGCNTNYSINNILHKNSSYLANYAEPIILKNLYSNYMRVSSVTLNRPLNRYNVNHLKDGSIQFYNQAGLISKKYNFSFDKDEEQKIVQINQRSYWKYVKINTAFQTDKRMPFEYGYIQLKGYTIESEVYQELLNSEIRKSLQIQPQTTRFQIQSIKQTSQSIVQITLKLDKCPDTSINVLTSHLLKSPALSVIHKPREINEANKQIEVQHFILRDIDNFQAKQINEFYLKTQNPKQLVKEILKNQNFSFTKWDSINIRKFWDISLQKTVDLKQQLFGQLFDKILLSQQAKIYFLDQCADLGQCYVAFPQNYLHYMMKKITNLQHQQNLHDLLTVLPKFRSQKYSQIRKNKIPYLLYEQSFYSRYYLDEIQKVSQNKQQIKQKHPLYESFDFIPSQIVIIKDDFSKKIYMKLQSSTIIKQIVLRFDKAQSSSEIHFKIYQHNDNKIYQHNDNKKSLVLKDKITQYQLSQITSPNNQEENTFCIDLNNIECRSRFLQIQVLFCQTQIYHQSVSSKNIAFIDIIPQLYGQKTKQIGSSAQIDRFFSFKEQESFYIQTVELGYAEMEKHSITKDNQYEYSYLKVATPKVEILKRNITQKLQRNDFTAAITDHKKLVKSYKKTLRTPLLDYVYTVMMLTLQQIFEKKIKIQEDICKRLFEQIITKEVGPIRISAFKVASNSVKYLLKSLPFIEQESYLPNLKQTTFDQKEIEGILDLKDTSLCNSLNKLIINSISYKDEWAIFLIKMNSVTQKSQQIIKYILKSSGWYNVTQILKFFSQISDNQFVNTLLSNIENQDLQKFILQLRKNKLTDKIHLLVEKLIQRSTANIDIDIVSMMLEDKEVKWHHLYKIIKKCPQAQDLIITQYLQLGQQSPQKLAQHYPEILNQAAKSNKHSQNVASFLSKLFSISKQGFKKAITNLSEEIFLLHPDLYEVLAFYLYEECNFGGLQGSKVLSERQLTNLHVGQILLKRITAISVDQSVKQLSQQQLLIQWFFCNNDYEHVTVSPSNRTPGMHLMKSLSQRVLLLIQHLSIDKILSVFDRLITKIRFQQIPLSTKHIYISQINYGASQLLQKSMSSQSLSQALLGKDQDNHMLRRIFQSLEKSTGDNVDDQQWKNCKEVDFTSRFNDTNVKETVKDWQANRNGTKNTLFKLPITEKSILLSSTEPEPFILSKIAIGFSVADNAEKNNVAPTAVQMFGGQNSNNLVKICDLKEIQDQHFTNFNIRVFSVNFNSMSYRKYSNPISSIEFRLNEPFLTSLSDIFQNNQKTKKDAFYSISFVSLSGYSYQPTCQPSYNQIYKTLLLFLNDPKYRQTLKNVVNSKYYKANSSSILRLLNSLPQNKQIQNLLLALNQFDQNVLANILSKNIPNVRLVQLLVESNPNKQNILKLLQYFVQKQSDKIINILVTAIKIYSYSNKSEKINFNFKQLVSLYYQSNFNKNVLKVVAAVLSTPNVFEFKYSALVETFWKLQQKERQNYYELIGSTLTYYPQQLQSFLTTGKTENLVSQIIKLIKEQPNVNVHSHIYLLSVLALHYKNRQYFIENNTPITIVELLKNEQTLLNRNYASSMKYFILFFQSTCIGSKCEDTFSQILINLMVKLPEISSAHHNFFIHEFFFPLINAYKGVPVKFVWKDSINTYLRQVTSSLKNKPIKLTKKTLVIDGMYLQQVEAKIASKLVGQQGYVLLNSKNQIVKANREFTQSQKKEYKLYKNVTNQSKNSLTNQTLTTIKNIGIFGNKYQNVLPVQDSTFQNVYYLSAEMTLQDILRQINLCGLKLPQSSLSNIMPICYPNNSNLSKSTALQQLFPSQCHQLLTIQINPQSVFSSMSIEQISCSTDSLNFIPQQTIFKAFEKKQGLMKMITVLKTCVKNWANQQMVKIWQQYLSQLESYSVFPVFSSIYINKKDNVQLLFNILSGLPDKEDPKKWIDIEKDSVKFLYDIVKDVFQVKGSKALEIRKFAVENGFYTTMLDRLHLVSKQIKRQKVLEQIPEQEIELNIPTNLNKIASQEDYKLKVVKKKGIGYGTDSSSNQKWDISGHQSSKKQQDEQILGLLKILQKFIDHSAFQPPRQIIDQSYESSLLPILQSSLRGGSLLQISKSAQLFKGQLSFVKALTKKRSLVPILMQIPKHYQPKQHQSIFQLLKILDSTSKIFLACLTGSVSQKLSQEIAKSINQTFELVQQAVSSYQLENIDEDQEKKILELPLAKKYPILLKDLRFDYLDMKDKNGKISKHHYASNYIANHKSPATKTIRLAQQLADISHALPVQHTNAIFVRCDKERVDFMQALIMGSNGTPYGHGAYLFDIYFDDTYPNNPPKVNLTTTGSGQIRFNPNLYSCGKVCLSLLGTWRGSAMENWDAKVSTLLQILVSIQSIIMSQEVYFNQPGFQHEQGTVQGEKKNQAYANVVRYGNVKFAMLQNIKNPPKGFENVIRRHFYLKKDQILQQTKKWLKYAQKRQASYTGLVSDHNNNWCTQFRKSKTQYKTSLEKAINQLQIQLNKLPQPSNKDLVQKSIPKKQKKKKVKISTTQDQNLDQVDVTYEKGQNNLKQLDINDEKVKDRWSRYIGAMGIEAVSKQAKANILLFGLGPTGVQIAKNIILSGCKKISIVETKNVQFKDLAGQFFVTQDDVGKNRLESCLYKLQELNHYVRVQALNFSEQNLQVLKAYDVIILTEQSLALQKLVNAYCHQNNIKFIMTDCYGPYAQHFNDFGTKFEVLDKNGEQTVQVMIESITKAEKGVVTLLNKQRHPYEDGDTVRISGVKGMVKQNGESINETFHKIRVINQFSFEIGNTTQYSDYEIDGLARNMKLPIYVEFKTFEQSLKLCNIDENLSFYDFQKSTKNQLLHKCFITYNTYKEKNNKDLQPWNWEDGESFISLLKQIHTEELTAADIKFVRSFAYTCSGTFAPLSAFLGGFTAQQAFKAITGKYMPVNQYFFTQFSEVIPELPQKDEELKVLLQKLNKEQQNVQTRRKGIKIVIGDELAQKIQKCRVFLIGSGAIGCQLLKNYAMINLGASNQGGQIIVTDPDHIQESNLNRQFLFRQKHLRKPKSVTAAATITQMNRLLKGKIRARLDRVCQNTKDIFSNEFFQSLDIVTNALDNVKARQYVDQRCVQNKVALLESGTLSSKGHVQVIIPYLTETYGSKNDPAEDGEIPHCTLKMFPEETLHCVQWARDIFGKTFTLDPKALSKIVDNWEKYEPQTSDFQMLKSCKKLLDIKPESFEQALNTAADKFVELYRNDILQLLYTYPLDAKTKDGKAFWKLPKRPPTPITTIDATNELHNTFITSYAALLCKIFNVDYPKYFRKAERRVQICKQIAQKQLPDFTPNDKLAKQMANEVEKSAENQENQQQQEQMIEDVSQHDENSIFKIIKATIQKQNLVKAIKVNAQQFQKDDDQNGHIDLIYSMANLRADNYKLQPMDWMTTKLKAGRITPALSTTTSCVAALQTIQLIKYLKKCKLTQMRNSFINLAVPMIQTGQPGEVQKIKIHDDLITNVWERWDVGPLSIDNVTVGQLITMVQQKYKITVKIISILQGAQIYSDLVMGLQSKKAEKEEFLKKSLKQVLLNQLSAQDIKKFIDMTLVFETNNELCKHVPTLRIKFSE